MYSEICTMQGVPEEKKILMFFRDYWIFSKTVFEFKFSCLFTSFKKEI